MIQAMMPVNVFLMKFVVTLILIVTPNFGAKILFLPANVDSHIQLFSRVAADLTQLGHVTHVLAPSNARVPQLIAELEHGVNFSYATYPVDGQQSFTSSREAFAVRIRVGMSQSLWEKMSLESALMTEYIRHTEADCNRLLENDRVTQQIRSGSYQFAVMDPVGPCDCYYAIPYSMGIPYASLSRPKFTLSYRVPRLPSFVPLPAFTYTDRMSFGQRLVNFIVGNLLRQQTFTSTKYVRRLAPDRPVLNGNQLLLQVGLQFNWFFFCFSGINEVSMNFALVASQPLIEVCDVQKLTMYSK